MDIVLQDNGSVTAFGKTWTPDPLFRPSILFRDGETVYFDEARETSSERFVSGLGQGMRAVYGDFAAAPGLRFECAVLVYDGGDRADFTFVPLSEGEREIEEVRWPAPLTADGDGCYALLPTMQGQLVPSGWPKEIGRHIPFDGQMCSSAAYMPWWGEVTPEGGYLAVAESPWDMKYSVDRPAGGPTRIYARHLPSLGRMRYARTVSFYFLPAGCGYVDLCRRYREIADEAGRAVTLREKAAANPNVDRLVGACVMHVPGKNHVVPESRYYDREEPSNNESFFPFSLWEERARMLHEHGVESLYLHQDGWGQPGYDNGHPDYLPPCEELGGWEGMKSLGDTLHELGYLFGIHDQYRDYYVSARTYDEDNAVMAPDGSIHTHAIWAGGKQSYLCASLAPAYVKRNFSALLAHGIPLDAAYLDVFTCNDADECANPRHPMTRGECLRYRASCFRYLTAHGIVPSSEEVNDWAMDCLVFCHWAPYPADVAVPLPLFNLVYHDCVLIPWMMPAGAWGIPEGTTGFLHCLLNGGMAYVSTYDEGDALEENIRQVKIVRELHLHVAREKMVNHEFLSDDRARQRTTFSDGTEVTVDFSDGTYAIRYGDDQ